MTQGQGVNEHDVNTAVFEEFSDWPNRELSFSATQLKGCTMLAIISRKGVYLAHYWESISFSTGEADCPDPWKLYKSQENIFDKTVLRGLKVGIGRYNDPQQVSLWGQVNRFSDSDMQAYLVHPSSNDQEDGDYGDLWAKMKAVVVEKLPQLNTGSRWHEHPYDPVPDGELYKLRSTPRGRLLFKYDARHLTDQGTTEKRAMLWSETTLLRKDSWT
jgi:hypothetical protein